MSSEAEFYERLKEIELYPLFLADQLDRLDEEIEQNCIWISISKAVAAQTSGTAFNEFLLRVKRNRQQQLQNSALSTDLIYYSWFDEQAGQFRFNLINAKHEKLPFGCELVFVESETEIVNQFLSSAYLDGIPWEELENVDSDCPAACPSNKDDGANSFQLKVYHQRLTKYP